MLIFNVIGLGLAAGAAMIAGLVGVLLGKFDWFPPFEKPAAMAVTGVFMVVLDVWFRMKCGEGSLLHPRRGGHFFFIPLWLLGGGCTLLNLCGMLAGKPEVSARESSSYPQTSVSQPSSYQASLPSPSYANSSQM